MMINRVIISGGGTGGHIFPAIAIAQEIKNRNPKAEILFVGALGKMEMTRVPEAGFRIVGLPIAGLQRKLTFSNFLLPFKILKSLLKARKVLVGFKPDVVVGVGGYASGPTLKAANWLKIPTVIQEQNSFPGKTNKLLAPKAAAICTAYEGLEKFFPKEKIHITGNPIRKDVVAINGKRDQAIKHFSLEPELPTILIMGGSLGAKTLNESVVLAFDTLKNANVQVIWQCGKLYYEKLNLQLAAEKAKNIHLLQFIDQMDLVYAAADVIISRAGAMSVSELSIVNKPTILVPSPNVSEDHQTKNAMALVNEEAAILVRDNEAREILIKTALDLIEDKDKASKLSENIAKLGKPNATAAIVDVIEKVQKIAQ